MIEFNLIISIGLLLAFTIINIGIIFLICTASAKSMVSNVTKVKVSVVISIIQVIMFYCIYNTIGFYRSFDAAYSGVAPFVVLGGISAILTLVIGIIIDAVYIVKLNKTLKKYAKIRAS